MFGFLKRKKKENNDTPSDFVLAPKDVDESVTAAESVDPSTAKDNLPTNNNEDLLNEDDLGALVRLWFSRNNFAAMYFAHCSGFTGETLSPDNFNDFWRLASSPNETVTQEGRLYAFQHFSSEVWAAATSLYSINSLNEIRQDDVTQTRLRRKLEKLQFQHKSVDNLVGAISEHIDAEGFVFDHVIALKQSELDIVWEAFEDKKKALIPLFRKAVRTSLNKYGDRSYTPLINEMDEFITYKFGRKDSSGEVDGFEFDYFWMVSPAMGIIDRVLLWLDESEGEEHIPSDGIDFEYWCADQLEKQGWTCSVSRASGDQGVDVLAVRGGFSVAIQCKRYRAPIGNKAVQEVFAGQKNVEASAACIIGTGGFTKSAQELARSTSVSLIEAEDIVNFSEVFGFESVDSEGNDYSSIKSFDPDERCYSISFSSASERAWGNVFRNVIVNFKDHSPHLEDELADIVLQGVEQYSGAGKIEVSEMELVFLLSYSHLILNGEVKATKDNLQALEHEHPQFVCKIRDEGIESFRYVESIIPAIRREMKLDVERFLSGTMREAFPENFDPIDLSALDD